MAFNIPAAMIRGNIAIPSAKSLRRPRPQRKPRQLQDMPTIIEGVRSPQEIAKAKRIAKLRLG